MLVLSFLKIKMFPVLFPAFAFDTPDSSDILPVLSILMHKKTFSRCGCFDTMQRQP